MKAMTTLSDALDVLFDIISEAELIKETCEGISIILEEVSVRSLSPSQEAVFEDKVAKIFPELLRLRRKMQSVSSSCLSLERRLLTFSSSKAIKVEVVDAETLRGSQQANEDSAATSI